jgi:alpha-tubulin suppressor-like RCC1 family protein
MTLFFMKAGPNVHALRVAVTALVMGLALPAAAQVPNIVQVAAGGSHTCALEDTGQVWCWGQGGNGQLGDGTTVSSATPTLVPGLDNVVQIALGIAHTCALRTNGRLRCWGWNENGQLGDGTITNRLSPVPVPGLGNVAQIALGLSHTCARQTNGRLLCWGDNFFGQLGDGSGTNVLTPPPPTRVLDLRSVAEVALGGYHRCARQTNGRLRCWGWNGYGQLGDGTTTDRLSPVPVPGLGNVAQIALGCQSAFKTDPS